MNDWRCASVARSEGFEPLGTAGSQRGFLLVDWPLPWPDDLGDVPALAPLHEALRGTGVRLQGVVPADAGRRRLVLHRRRAGEWFTGYERLVRHVDPADAVPAAVELLAAVDPAVPPEAAGAWIAGAPDDPVRGDVLVCTHGRRDPCCGREGTVLALALAGMPEVAEAGYALARTSHTGGHRFAPTAIVLPQGTMWAFLDPDTAVRILRREGPVAAVLDRYRGSTGIGSPALQAAERAAFAEVGWSWLDWRRRGEDLGEGRVRVVGRAPDGTEAAWEASVEDRSRPVPVCGRPLDEAVKRSTEPFVVAIGRA